MSEQPHTPNHLAREGAALLAATALMAGGQLLEANPVAHDIQPAHTSVEATPTHPLDPLTPPISRPIGHAGPKPTSIEVPHVPIHVIDKDSKRPTVITVSTHQKSPETNKPTSEHKPPKTPVLLPPIEKPPVRPPELLNLHPENLSVPANVSEIMHRDVAYLPQLLCSGFLVRDTAGNAIGVETAQHCSLRSQDGHWSKGDNGPTISFGQPMEVDAGDSMKELSKVGEITQLVLNGSGDNQHDQALGVFAGHTAQEVLDAYNQNHLSVDAITQLQKGDVIYNSGWPVNQLNNQGAMERQEFAMSVLGTVTWNVTNGDTLNLLLAAVPEAKDGTECSWGNSGSEGFVVQTITLPDGTTKEVPMAIGTASAFNDFGLLLNKDPQAAAIEKTYIESEFGVSMDGYAAVCGFSYITPSTENGMVVADVLTPQTTETTPPTIVDTLEQQLDLQFSDPTANRQIIHGLVEIPAKTPFWVKDPTYAYDPTTKSLVVAFADGAGKGGGDGISFWNFDGVTGLQNTIVYSPDGQTAPDITTTSTGVLTPGQEVSAGFTDQNGLVIGQNLGSEVKTVGTAYAFSTDGGQLSLNAEAGK